LVVVFERVVVVPPSGSVCVLVWLSELPATPSRYVSFCVISLPFASTPLVTVVVCPVVGATFVVVVVEPGTPTDGGAETGGGEMSPGEETAGGGARGIDGGGAGG
jgi:hypothetical protein